MKIILVDDEKKFTTMLAKRLKLRGLEAEIAFSGNEAIEKVKEKTFDVAVLDVKMPGISGLQLKERLCELAPGLKVVFVTGHGGPELCKDQEDCTDVFMSKPLDIDILIETLNRVQEGS